MTNKIKIAPSILAADFSILGQQVKDAQAVGGDIIHVDVMDGRFVPNITMGPLVVSAVRNVTDLPLDIHLMIVEPANHIKAFVDAGADRISIHMEADNHVHRTLSYIESLGCKRGVAINPHTPASVLSEIMHMVDVIIVMTVNPGYGGQSFLSETMPKVTQIRDMIVKSGRDIDIEVDGGISAATAQTAVDAGANVLIAGSAVFNAKHSVADGINAIRHSLKS